MPISLLLNKPGPMREEEGRTGDPHPLATIEAAVAPGARRGGSAPLLLGEIATTSAGELSESP